MKFLKKLTILTVIYSILYLAGALILAYTQISYRAWAEASGKIVIIYVLPLLGIIWTVVWLKRVRILNCVVKVIVILIEVVIYAGWAYLGFHFIFFSVNTERILTPNLLITDESGFLQELHCVYGRPVALFFKMPTELTAEDMEVYLERKYGREFEIVDADNHVFYDMEFPQVSVFVRLSGMEFEDDFVKSVLTDFLPEGMEALDIDREYYVEEYSSNRHGIFFICLEDESDIPELAEDVCRLIDYVSGKTDLFEENRGCLYFYCGEYKRQIPFGKLGEWDKQDSDYYLYPEKMQEYIQEQYDKAASVN